MYITHNIRLYIFETIFSIFSFHLVLYRNRTIDSNDSQSDNETRSDTSKRGSPGNFYYLHFYLFTETLVCTSFNSRRYLKYIKNIEVEKLLILYTYYPLNTIRISLFYLALSEDIAVISDTDQNNSTEQLEREANKENEILPGTLQLSTQYFDKKFENL